MITLLIICLSYTALFIWLDPLFDQTKEGNILLWYGPNRKTRKHITLWKKI